MSSYKTMVPGILRETDAPYGGSLQGEFRARYTDLVKLLGDPNPYEGGDGKVSTEWTLSFRGEHFRVYDYKETSLYDSDLPSVREFRQLSSYDWHVGCSDKRFAAQVIGRIEDALEDGGVDPTED